MKVRKYFFKMLCLVLLCVAQMGCALFQLPIDLLSSAVSTAVSAGIAAAPYAAPFFSLILLVDIMDNLAKSTVVGSTQLIIGLGVLLFVPAGTLNFGQAWIYLLISTAAIILIFSYLFKNDSKLLERRLNRAEKEKSQKPIQFFIFMTYIAALILPSLDHRFLWSNVPVPVTMAGDILVALGYLIIFTALKVNAFAGSTVEVAVDHKVISTGPYAIIRHPMYAGGIVILGGTPLALGSWWGILAVVLAIFPIIWRLVEEEKFLSQGLSGYKGYCQKVQYRLVPFIW